MVQPASATVTGNDKKGVAPAAATTAAPVIDLDHIEELRGKIPSHYLAILTAAEQDPTGLEKFKTAVYSNLWDPKKAPGVDALGAYLEAVDKKDLATGVKQVEAAYSIDKPAIDDITGGVLRFLGGGAVNEASSVIAAMYPKVTSYGRVFMSAELKYIDWLDTYSKAGAQNDGDNEKPPNGEARKQNTLALLKILKGKGEGVFATPPDKKEQGAPGAVQLGPAPLTPEQEKQLAAAKKRIMEVCPAPKAGAAAGGSVDHAKVTALITEIKALDPVIQERLRTDGEVTLRLTGLGSELGSVAKALDSLEALVEELEKPPEGTAEVAILTRYLKAPARADNPAARLRVLTDDRVAKHIRGLSDEDHRSIVRLATRGKDNDPIDVIFDFAGDRENAGVKPTVDQVLEAMMSIAGDSSRVASLRSDLMFRKALQHPALMKPAQAGGLSIVPYDYMMRVFGEEPQDTNDPERKKQKVVNPDPADVEPLKPEDYRAIEALVKSALDTIAPKLESWTAWPDAWTKDQPVVDALTKFENAAAEKDMKSRFRRGHMNPGAELVKAANKDSRIGDIRTRLHKCLGEEGRQVCERVLNIRVDAAAVGQVGDKFQVPGASGLKDGQKKVPLEQALREIKINDKTLTQYIHDTCTKIRDEVDDSWEWSDASPANVRMIWSTYSTLMSTKMAELAELTGLVQGPMLHAVQFLVNAYREIPKGGSLSQQLSTKFAKKTGELNQLLTDMGLDAASVKARALASAGPVSIDPDADVKYSTSAEGLWSAISQSEFGPDWETYASSKPQLEKIGEKLNHARKVDKAPTLVAGTQDAQPTAQPTAAAGPPQRVDGNAQQNTFALFYKAKYGIDPERHVAEFARSFLTYVKNRHDAVVAEAEKLEKKKDATQGDKEKAQQLRDNAKTLELTSAQVAEPLGINADQIGAAVSKPAVSGVVVDDKNRGMLPDGYAPEMAHASAKRIWDELHSGGDIIKIRQQIDGKRPEEVRLINVAFRELSGDIDIAFYLKQSQQTGTFKVGGDGLRDKGSELAQTSPTSIVGDAGSIEQVTEIAQTGQVNLATALRNAAESGKEEICFDIAGRASPTEKQQILANDATMDMLRQKLNETAFDRVYAELNGTCDLANMLWSHSSEKSKWAYTWGTTDREGMEKDIKEYIRRRKEFHASSYEKAGLKVDEIEVERRVKEDTIKAFSNPEVRGVIETECHGLFRTSTDAQGQDMQGQLLSGGSASKMGVIAGIPNSSWTSTSSVIAAINAMTPAEREKCRNDPEFWLRLDELNVANPAGGRQEVLDALNSRETDGNDHLSIIAQAMNGWKGYEEAFENLGKLTPTEIARLKSDPMLVAKIRGFIQNNAGEHLAKYLQIFDTFIGLKTADAAAADLGAKPKLDDKGKPVVDATGKPIYEIPNLTGTVPVSEIDRIEYSKQSAIARITTAAHRDEVALLKESVEVFKMEFRPTMTPPAVQPAPDGAPQAPTTPDRAAIEKERTAGKEYAGKIRGEVWAAVKPDVDVRAGKDETLKTTVQHAIDGTIDPSHDLLKKSVGWYDDDKQVVETIKKASNQVIVKEWASVIHPKYAGGDGGGVGMDTVLDEYKKARAKRPKPGPDGKAAPMSLKDEKDLQAARIRLQRYVIEPSIVFETTLLPHTGMGYTSDDKGRQEKDKEYGNRDNTQWHEWRKELNTRIKSLPDADVATELKVGPDDAEAMELIGSSLRHAETNLSIAKEEYGAQRTDGYKYFGDDHGRELDRAFGDYQKSVGQAEDSTKQGGDISADKKKELDKHDENFGAKSGEYQAARNAAADWAGQIAAALIGIALTALLPGAGTVAAMAMYGAIVGAAAATGDTLVHEAMLGKTYDGTEQAVKNITTGAVTGMVSGAANHYSGQIINGLMPLKSGTSLQQAEVIAGVATAPKPGVFAKMATEGGKMAINTAASGATNVALSALDPAVWMYGWDHGWNQVAATIGAQIKGVAWDTFQKGLIAAGSAGVMHFAHKNAAALAAVEPGKRPTVGRVLAEIKQSLPAALLQGAIEGVVKGENIDGVLKTTGKAGLGALKDLKQNIDDGAVGQADIAARVKNFAQHELLANATKFASGEEVLLYTQMIVSGSEISASDFIAARKTVARARAMQGGHTLTDVQLQAFEHWCREAPTPEEFKQRTERNPLDIPQVKDAVAAPQVQEPVVDTKGPKAEAKKLQKDADMAADGARGAAEAAERAERAYEAAPTPEVGKKSVEELRLAYHVADMQLAKAQKAVDALKAALLTAPTEHHSAIEACLKQAEDALTAAHRDTTLVGLAMRTLEGKLGLPSKPNTGNADEKTNKSSKDGDKKPDTMPRPQDLGPVEAMALADLIARKGEKAGLEEWRNLQEGRTKEGVEINSTIDPGTDYHGRGRATADKAAVIAKGNAEILSVVAIFGPDVQVSAAGVNTYKFTLKAPAATFTIRLDAGPVNFGQVARSQVNTERGDHVIQFSHQAADDVIGRALAHEIAEIITETRMAANKDAPVREDVLRPGPHDPTRTRLSPHDMGRVFEITYLATQMKTAMASSPTDVPRVRAQLLGLVDTIGLRRGTAGANERLSMIAAHLSAEAASMLAEAAKPLEELTATDKDALKKIKETADLRDKAQLDKEAQLKKPLHEEVNPKEEDLKDIDASTGKISKARAAKMAQEAQAARAAKSAATIKWLRGLVAASGGKPPIISKHIQIGGGAAVAALTAETLFIDPRGRWQSDPSKEIAQTAGQMKGVKESGIGTPEHFANPDQRIPLEAVRYWEDSIAAQALVVDGYAEMKFDKDGNLMMTIKPLDGSGEIVVQVDGTPTIATGFPREKIPGSKTELVTAVQTIKKALATLGTPEAVAALAKINNPPPGKPLLDPVSGEKYENHGLSEGEGAATAAALTPTLEAALSANPDNADALATLKATKKWVDAVKDNPGKVLHGDEGNLNTVDPNATDNWIIGGVGGTSISAAEIILHGNPRAKVTMLGYKAPEGLEKNTQWQEILKKYGPPPGDGRFDHKFGVRVGEIDVGTDAAGKPEYKLDGKTAAGYIVAIGRDGAIPMAIADMCYTAYSKDKNNLKGELMIRDGRYLGYRLIVEVNGKTHKFEVTGAASRFLPPEIFTDADWKVVGAAGKMDAASESGNFDGGYASSAAQASDYRRDLRDKGTP